MVDESRLLLICWLLVVLLYTHTLILYDVPRTYFNLNELDRRDCRCAVYNAERGPPTTGTPTIMVIRPAITGILGRPSPTWGGIGNGATSAMGMMNQIAAGWNRIFL